MARVLVTGMSGTGKSTVVAELAARGYRAIDLDDPPWSEWAPADGNPTGANPGHDWAWDEARVGQLLSSAPGDLVVSGCAPNMGRFLRYFDEVVLLTAPAATLLERLASRDTNPYGKRPEEAARVMVNQQEVEPWLRELATHEIDATQPLLVVVEAVAALARGLAPPSRGDATVR